MLLSLPTFFDSLYEYKLLLRIITINITSMSCTEGKENTRIKIQNQMQFNVFGPRCAVYIYKFIQVYSQNIADNTK